MPPENGGAEVEQDATAAQASRGSDPEKSGQEAGSRTKAEGLPEEGEAADPLQEELHAVRSERDKMRDQLLRTTADFENFRRRSRREIEEAKMRGKDDAIKELLPIFDNLERAVQASESATEIASVIEGVNMVLKLFEDTAQRMGLNRVPGVGSQFDPAVHEAIQQLETDDYPPGAIVNEVAAGYMFGQRLLRAGMVVVARPVRKAAADASAEPAGERERTSDVAPKGTGDSGEADAASEDS